MFQESFFFVFFLFQSFIIQCKLTDKATELQTTSSKSKFVIMFSAPFAISNFSQNRFLTPPENCENSMHCVGCRPSGRWREHKTGAQQTQKFLRCLQYVLWLCCILAKSHSLWLAEGGLGRHSEREREQESEGRSW